MQARHPRLAHGRLTIGKLHPKLFGSASITVRNIPEEVHLYLSAITVAELRFGLAAMPQGKRRRIYLERLEREALPAFSGRIVPFDLESSRAYSDLMTRARKADKAIGCWTATSRPRPPRAA